ncbi:hypothetical protein NG895_13450 [Aeoliella sp. ICT_H6.2]|uniref:Uncharacterized protein n=1 Tax=Aeoliella straminimaris TaxID=2954799 RepID=A0A9X2F9R5_9BACT|nr:hypothetical protein [Aeoliella straminimaris]MCO6044910.1 hypothetical protein [Aeoliella straminimaris]
MPTHVVTFDTRESPQWLTGEWTFDEATGASQEKPESNDSWVITSEADDLFVLRVGDKVLHLNAWPVQGQPETCMLEISLVEAGGVQLSGAIQMLCMAEHRDGILTVEPLSEELIEGWQNGPGITVFSQKFDRLRMRRGHRGKPIRAKHNTFVS